MSLWAHLMAVTVNQSSRADIFLQNTQNCSVLCGLSLDMNHPLESKCPLTLERLLWQQSWDLWLWMWMNNRAQGQWSSTKEMKFSGKDLESELFLMHVADYGHQRPMPRQHLNTKIQDISLLSQDAWHPHYLQMAWCAEIASGIKFNVVKSKLMICPLGFHCRIIFLCCLETQFTIC